MPTIDPSLVPSVSPGSLFSKFTEDPTINIRWFVAVDPVTHTVLNRPIADLALRQLILSKTVDSLNLRLGHQALFPFIVQAQVNSGTQNVDIPPSWIWDMQVSLPQKWENLRLSKLRRLSGLNDDSYTGLIQLMFTANEEGTTQEVAVFKANYQINSTLTYQRVRVAVPLQGEESLVISESESETVGGFITFRTLDPTDAGVASFYNVVAPPDDITNVDSGGLYVNPVAVDINDSTAGGSGISDDFNLAAVSHGTGMLTHSAYNAIPSVDSTIATWLATFNFPFDASSNLQSSSAPGVVIPAGLFKEFSLTVPSGDEPTGDISANYYPVWVSRIERVDVSSDTLDFIFATYNIESPSLVPVEFASLRLLRGGSANTVIAITPLDGLFPTKSGDSLWQQGFGTGHVMLSDIWGSTGGTIDDFFDSFITIIDEPPQAVFTKESSRLSSYGLSRVPEYTPTLGQAAALRGSTDGITDPSSVNRYVMEADQGLGTQIDFATNTGLAEDRRENPDIERFGFTGSLVHKLVKLVVDTSGTDHDYENDILPRLEILLGRSPVLGDMWFDGTTFKIYSGDAWIA